MSKKQKGRSTVITMDTTATSPTTKMSKQATSYDWRSLTYLDLFPFNPAYRFNGFRSIYGTVLSILLLFAVFLRVVTLLLSFIGSDPLLYNETKPISELKESVTCPSMGVRMLSNNLPFYDSKTFLVHFYQGNLDASGLSEVEISTRSCDIIDPAGLIKYTKALCPVVNGTLQGDFPMARFKYVRVVFEECVNTTVWNSDTNTYDLSGSTTAGLGTENACRPKEDIDATLKASAFSVYLTERMLRPNSWRKVSEYIQVYQRKFPSGLFQSHQTFIGVTRINFLARYIFDKYNNVKLYPSIAKEDEKLSDLDFVVGTDTNQHLYRLEYVVRLDRFFTNQIRQNISMYTLFESWAASAVFFTGAFGSMAWLINRYLFKEQTRGLDIRKMDRDQFDKFGRLVDKSFQMPRELQDMQAE